MSLISVRKWLRGHDYFKLNAFKTLYVLIGYPYHRTLLIFYQPYFSSKYKNYMFLLQMGI